MLLPEPAEKKYVSENGIGMVTGRTLPMNPQ